jgi:hypothetical protein
MIDNLLKTTDKVLGKHKLPADATKAIHDHMRAAKAPLDDIMGLHEGNMFRVAIPITKDEDTLRREYPQTYAVVAHLLHEALQGGMQLDLSTISLVKNEVLLKGQPGKISKIVAKQLASKEDIITHCAKEIGIEKPAQFMPKLGDVIKSGRKLVLSSNILDFLTSSSNASFTSCHSFDGCHFNGNLAYIRDAITLISFIVGEKDDLMAPENRKLGRCWVYNPLPHVVMPKSYGGYFDFEREAVRRYVLERISAKFGIEDFKTVYGITYPSSSVIYEKPTDGSSGAALYLDNYGLEVSSPAGHKGLPTLEFSAAMCLMCAGTTARQKGGVCNEHTGKARGNCAGCGERKDLGSLYTVQEQHYCTRCVERLFKQCGMCAQYHPRETLVSIGGRSVCPGCVEREYTNCACCNKQVRNRDTAELGNIGMVCTTCVHKYMQCSVCNEYHLSAEVAYHKYVGRVCNTCAPGVSFVCGTCGEHYHNKYKKALKDSGAEVCTKCHAAATGKELSIKAMPKYVGLPAGWEDFTEEVG